MQQHGAITLAVSLTILTLSTLVGFAVSRAMLMEQKLTNNEVRAMQAFDAAEAGMMQAYSYLVAYPDDTAYAAMEMVGAASVAVSVTELSGDRPRLLVSAQGAADDHSAGASLSQQLVRLNALPGMPLTPLIARGALTFSGVTRIRNPEGSSTLWSGGGIDLGTHPDSATAVPDMTDAGYPVCLELPGSCVLVTASSRTLPGIDMLAHDASLAESDAEEFFHNFFGMPPQRYRATMVSIDTAGTAAQAALQLAQNEVIWVEGSHSFNGGTVGCSTALSAGQLCPPASQGPAIVIVNGDADIVGALHFYGMLFVLGELTLSATVTLHGAAAVAGNVSGGSIDIWYNSGLLLSAAHSGPLAVSAGSWKDF
ncbi:MAG TPA: hypothetical protein GX696_04595 [Pseudomonadaceae bacterium]|nr:hypothetical protein [Pseudomonadaceae bacterium]